MAETVYGAALSHSPLMFVPGVDGGAAGKRYWAAVERLRDEMAAVDPDAVVMFFPDHFRAVHYDNTPPFCLGVKYLATWGDWYLPRLDLRLDEELAAHVLERVLGAGIDLAYSVDMRVDHGGAQPLHVLGLEDRPVVPVFVNCAAPPLPTLARCAALGAAVGEAVASFPGVRRVAVLGSGGLSHHVPLPSWQELTKDDGDRYRTFVTGLSDAELAEVEPRRVQRILDMIGTDETWTDEELDRDVLAEFASGALSDVVARSQEDLVKRGGSGMNEVRTWVAAFSAARSSGAEILEYTTVARWATGMGVVRFDLGPQTLAAGAGGAR